MPSHRFLGVRLTPKLREWYKQKMNKFYKFSSIRGKMRKENFMKQDKKRRIKTNEKNEFTQQANERWSHHNSH